LKATLKLDRLNCDPEYLHGKICEAFPELLASGVNSRAFKLWQVRLNKTELIPLPVDINNAQALFGFEELNRSCVYIKADVSTDIHTSSQPQQCIILGGAFLSQE